MSDAPAPAAAPAVPPQARAFPNLRQTFLLLGLFLATTGLALAAFRPVRHGISEQLWFFLVVLVGEGIGVLCGLRLARWPLRRMLGHLGFSTRALRRLLVIGVGNLLLVGSLLYVLAHLFGPLNDAYLLRLFTVRNAGEFLLLFLTVAVVAPFVEEVLVRGIVLRGLTLSWGVPGGVLWSAFFFALIHLNPLQAAPAFVNGVVWAIVLLRTGSLGATLFLHCLHNGLVFLLVQTTALAQARGWVAGGSELAGPPALKAVLVAGLGLLGLVLVLRALRALPRAPDRLAAFWGVTSAGAADIAVSGDTGGPATRAARPGPPEALSPRGPLPGGPSAPRSAGSPPEPA